MILSRAKPAGKGFTSFANQGASGAAGHISTHQVPKLEDCLKDRDFTGAMTLLEFERSSGTGSLNSDLWLAYSAFHLGDYKRALLEYEGLAHKLKDSDLQLFVNIACCYFYLGMYTESQQALNKSPSGQLKVRLSFHLSHKFGDENQLMEFHQQLQDVTEDQLSLASIHYLRAHYQEAIDIYKRLLLDNREYLALNVYVALCYYKLDYYDVSQEVLQMYLQHFPDSVIAVNLKACNHFRLYNGKAAENELRPLTDQLTEAYRLIKELEPTVPQEYILKGIVNAALGQETGSRELLAVAQQYFQLVGGSASECDTIPGRQCMASCFFLMKQFEDVLLYLSSIRSYFASDDSFNFNLGQVKAAVGNYKEAEEILLLIQSEKLRTDFAYFTCLARCYIMNRKAKLAWDIYARLETSSESYHLLHIVANDCYRTGQFVVAARAFDILEKLDGSNPEFWEGKRGACVGTFQMVIAGGEPKFFFTNQTSRQEGLVTRVILSGPTGGVVGNAQTTPTYLGDSTPGIGFDIGGTSTDFSRYAGQGEHIFQSTTAGITVQAPQVCERISGIACVLYCKVFIGMRRVYIHRYAGVLSAYGLALADVLHEGQEPANTSYSASHFQYLDERLAALERKCEEQLKKQGFESSFIEAEAYLHLRVSCQCGSHGFLIETKTIKHIFLGYFIRHLERERGDIQSCIIPCHCNFKISVALELNNARDRGRVFLPGDVIVEIFIFFLVIFNPKVLESTTGH
nr:EOG090X04LA [Lepidurus arcticus]